jgi:hypothetical protein
VNESALSEIEQSFGFSYPPSFRSAVREFAAYCCTPAFKRRFPTAEVLLSAAAFTAERKLIDYRDSMGVLGVPMPREFVESGRVRSSTLVPFLKDKFGASLFEQDTYAFDLESTGPEYSVVVLTYGDTMIVYSWDSFAKFNSWLCETVATNESSHA